MDMTMSCWLNFVFFFFVKIQYFNVANKVVAEGFKVMHGGHLMTVFSARNYCGTDTNDAALLLVAEDENGQTITVTFLLCSSFFLF